MSNRNPTPSELQEIAKSESEKLQRQIMDAVDRQHYDMRHPYWRQELDEYMQTRGVTKNAGKDD